MKLLPYDNLCIVTSLNPGEVQERLQSEVSPKPKWGFKALFADTGDKYFTGTVENDRFEIIRIIQGRNSFLPVIKGHTETWLNGSRIYVKMRLHLFVAAVMCFWLGIAGMIAISMIIACITKGQFGAEVFAPFGMFAVGYGMMMGFYSSERNDAKRKLLEILVGQIDDTAIYHERKY